jgi:hypothetical protein
MPGQQFLVPLGSRDLLVASTQFEQMKGPAAFALRRLAEVDKRERFPRFARG